MSASRADREKDARPDLKVDGVNSPTHYTHGGIECIDAIKAQMSVEEFRGYCRGNVAKYMWRCNHKQGVVSLEKARWYLNKLIETYND